MNWKDLKTKIKTKALANLVKSCRSQLYVLKKSDMKITMRHDQFEKILSICWARTVDQFLELLESAPDSVLKPMLEHWKNAAKGNFTAFDQATIAASAKAYLDLMKTGDL